MTQYKVVKESPYHHFKAGEVVTKAASGTPQDVLFRDIAVLLGADKDPRYEGAAAYINASGDVQVLNADEVAAI